MMNATDTKMRKREITHLQKLLLKTPVPINELRRGFGGGWVGVQMLDGLPYSNIDVPGNPNLDPDLIDLCGKIRQIITKETGSTRFQLSIETYLSPGSRLTFFLEHGFRLDLGPLSARANATAIYEISDAIQRITGQSNRGPFDIMKLVQHWIHSPNDAHILKSWKFKFASKYETEQFIPLE